MPARIGQAKVHVPVAPISDDTLGRDEVAPKSPDRVCIVALDNLIAADEAPACASLVGDLPADPGETGGIASARGQHGCSVHNQTDLRGSGRSAANQKVQILFLNLKIRERQFPRRTISAVAGAGTTSAHQSGETATGRGGAGEGRARSNGARWIAAFEIGD